MSLQTVPDLSETVVLESNLGLYLKPVSRIKINVQIPKLSNPGQSISSWHVMEKLKTTVRPDIFLNLKALKITSTVIKFEGELETKAACERALARLRAAGSVKINGFTEKLLVRAAHALASGPTRHDWEAFFRDAKGVNEMKPGERPDTVHLQELPVRWFSEGTKNGAINEKLVKLAFGTFGKVRRLEVPSRVEVGENTIGKTNLLNRDSVFEVYVQYEEYVEFAIAMDSLRGKKLLYKESNGKVYAADIKVDFDRTKYLSEACIKKREAEEKKLNPATSLKQEKEIQDKSDSQIETKPESPAQVKSTLPAQQVSHSQEHESKNSDLKRNLKVNVVLEDKKKALLEAKLLLKDLLLRAEVTERQKEQKRKLFKDQKESKDQKRVNEYSSKETSEKITKVIEERGVKESEKHAAKYIEEKHVIRKNGEETSRKEKRDLSEETNFRNKSERRHEEKRFKTEVYDKVEKKKLSHSDDKRRKEKSSKSTGDKYKERNPKHREKSKEKELHYNKISKSRSHDKKHKETDTPEKTFKDCDTFRHDKKHNAKVKEAHCDKIGKDDKRHKDSQIVAINKITEKKTENSKESKLEGQKEVILDEKEEKLRMHLEEQKIKERLIQAYNQKKRNEAKLLEQERILKAKLLRNLKARELKEREKLRKELAGLNVLKSVLGGTNSLSPFHKKS